MSCGRSTKLTTVEIEARYADYNHGWLDGANRRVLGTTPEPTYIDEYRKGHADGLASFNSAMKVRFEALTGKTSS